MSSSGHQDSRKPGIFRDIGRELVISLADVIADTPLKIVSEILSDVYPGTQGSLIPLADGAAKYHINFKYFDGNFYPLDFIFSPDESWDNKYLLKKILQEMKRGKYAFGASSEVLKENRRIAGIRNRKLKRLMRKYGVSRFEAEQALDGVTFLE